MRRWVSFLFILSIFYSPVVWANGLEDLKGADWADLSVRQKQEFVYTGIGALERQGVSLMKSPSYYIEALDKILKLDDELKKEYLDNLFVFCVHESEPHTRQTLDKIKNTQE